MSAVTLERALIVPRLVVQLPLDGGAPTLSCGTCGEGADLTAEGAGARAAALGALVRQHLNCRALPAAVDTGLVSRVEQLES